MEILCALSMNVLWTMVVETALELLQKAFVISVRTHVDAKPYISDAIQMLNLSSLE